MPKPKTTKSEYEIQKEVVNYLEKLKLIKKIDAFTAVPNSTFVPETKYKASNGFDLGRKRILDKNTETGVRPGFPDLTLVIQGKAYFVEIKKETRSKIQDNQKFWIKTLNFGEITAFVACSLQEVELIIEDILEQNETKNSKYFSQNLRGAKYLKEIMEFQI